MKAEEGERRHKGNERRQKKEIRQEAEEGERRCKVKAEEGERRYKE